VLDFIIGLPHGFEAQSGRPTIKDMAARPIRTDAAASPTVRFTSADLYS
jgi:hypothetical protein